MDPSTACAAAPFALIATAASTLSPTSPVASALTMLAKDELEALPALLAKDDVRGNPPPTLEGDTPFPFAFGIRSDSRGEGATSAGGEVFTAVAGLAVGTPTGMF